MTLWPFAKAKLTSAAPMPLEPPVIINKSVFIIHHCKPLTNSKTLRLTGRINNYKMVDDLKCFESIDALRNEVLNI